MAGATPTGSPGGGHPLAGRLMALVDVYDALICTRVYKEAFSHAEAAKIIIDERGAQFDPVVVDAFVELTEQFQAIAHTYWTASCPLPEPQPGGRKAANAAGSGAFSRLRW